MKKVLQLLTLITFLTTPFSAHLPIHDAVRAGDFVEVERLINEDPTCVDAPYVNTEYEHGDWTPLHLAVYRDNAAMVKLLLDRGANVDAQDNQGETALHVAVDRPSNDTTIAELLIGKGADVNARDRFLRTPLGHSLMFAHVEIAQLLLESGADINAKFNFGFSLLHLAVLNRRIRIVELLLEEGVDMNARDNNGLTPLSAAWARMRNGRGEYIEVIECLAMIPSTAARPEPVEGCVARHF